MTRCWHYVETDPVTSDEFILRTIPNQSQNYDPKAPEIPIQPSNFHPSSKVRDVDGLSFYRLDFISAKRLAKSNQHGAGVYVVMIPATDFFSLGLSLQPSIDPKIPGHLIVPEMNFAAYKANKNRMKDLAVILAKVASKAVVYGPTPPKPKQ